MNSLAKQRLVGMLVLLSVAVILWPVIFAPEKLREGADLVKIPPAPQVESSEEIILDLQKLNTQVKKIDFHERSLHQTDALSILDLPTEKDEVIANNKNLSSDRVRLVSPETPRLDEDSVPISYILQVVSMVDRERAENVRDTLIDLEYKAYLRQVKIGEATMYRVYVGPKIERAKLMSIKPTIDKIFEVDSVILSYSP